MVPDPKRFVPAYGRDELIVRAKPDLYNCVAMAGERESDTFCRSVIDVDILPGVAVGWRTGPGEEDYAGAGGVEGLGAEVAD